MGRSEPFRQEMRRCDLQREPDRSTHHDVGVTLPPAPVAQARRAAIVFLITVGGLIGAVASLFYVYDPLMVFHRAWGRDATLHESMRLQAAGIINNIDFDSIILGTSMLENTSADEAGRMLGGKFVNLSITASDHFERAIVLRYAYRKKPVLRRVIMSLDANIYGREGHPVFRPETFDFLYDERRINDFRAYAKLNFLRCAIRFSSDVECIGRPATLDRPNAWYAMPEQAVRFGGLGKWFAARNDWQVKAAMAAISKDARRVAAGDLDQPSGREIDVAVEGATAYVEKYVLGFVRRHPETDFYLFFPPYSRIRAAQMYQLNQVAAYIHEGVSRFLAFNSAALPNLHVHGFEDESFLDDLANYKDTHHYNERIDSMILMAMAGRRNVLDMANVDQYLSVAKDKALKFDLVGLGARIDEYLTSQRDSDAAGVAR